jgi:hypothetical protein
MKIWAYYHQTGKTELVDTCSKAEVGYMVREYQLAFGSTCTVWAGLKRDNPRLARGRGVDETAHYRGY